MARREPTDDPEDAPIPHDPLAEHAVLGSLLVDPAGYDAVAQVLVPDDFFGEACRQVYAAIAALVAAGEAVDMVSVHSYLERQGVSAACGGAPFLSGLAGQEVPSAHLLDTARLVHEAAQRRRLIAVGRQISQFGRRGDLDLAGALGQAEAALRALTDQAAPGGFVPLADLLHSLIDAIDERSRAAAADQAEALAGRARTGFVAIDEIVGGFAPTDLVILGARPATGKTSLALGIAIHTARQGKPVALFSIEMSAEQVAERLLAIEASVEVPRLVSGNIGEPEWERLLAAAGRLAELPIFVDEGAVCTPESVRGKTRLLLRQQPVGLVIVDHLSLMRSAGGGRERNPVQEMTDISRGLKLLARELAVPVLALSQLSRGLESREDHRPKLADLRQSGSLEQDADTVIFIYRDELYNDDSPDRGVAEIIVAKHRHGPIGRAALAWEGRFARFADLRPAPGGDGPPPLAPVEWE